MPAIPNPNRKNIFISYRVQDSAGETGRLVDALKEAFYDDQIFVDIEKLEPGVDFTEALAGSLDSCDILLAIIGPQWAGKPDSNGVTRINKPDDWVRIELETALKRNIRLIPVLVSGASLPSVEDIPESLLPLLKRQTIELSNKRWKYDCDQLINFLGTVGMARKHSPASSNITRPPITSSVSKGTKRSFKKYGIGILAIIGGLALIGAFLQDFDTVPHSEPKSQPVQNNVVSAPSPAKAIDQEKPEVIPVEVENENITAVWKDASGLFNLHIDQTGDRLQIQTVNFQGIVTGSGTGSISGRNVKFQLEFVEGGYSSGNGMVTDNNITGNCSGEIMGVPFAEPFQWIKN